MVQNASDKWADIYGDFLLRGQVFCCSSVAIPLTTAKVFIFTTLLFLSGYVLQQQTVRNIQAVIRPRPPPTPTPDRSQVVAKHFGIPRDHSFYEKFLVSNRPKGGWAKVAYVQVIREHIHVCNAVMLFAELERQESMAQRMILYPQEWNVQQSKQEDRTLKVKTSLRLLESAALRYKVELLPVNRILDSPDGKSHRSLCKFQPPKIKNVETEEAAYPLVNLLSLTLLNRLIYLRPSGLILDSAKLDVLFTLPMESAMLGISGNPQEEDTIPPVILIEPSRKAYNETLSSIPAGSYSDDQFLRHISFVTDTADQNHLVAKSSAIHLESDRFNTSKFIKSTSYVQLSDPGLPGPEYNIPRRQLLRAVPKHPTHRKAWETVYEMFREQRMSVCGLDLEPAPALESTQANNPQESEQREPNQQISVSEKETA